MSDECFFDTNILTYAYDEKYENKRVICKKLIEDIFKGKAIGVVSNQVLGELFKALKDKLGIVIEDAEIITKSFIASDNWIKVNYNANTVKNAITLVKKFNIQFWDAIIAETMFENGIFTIYTENEKDFKKVPGIKVANPLK